MIFLNLELDFKTFEIKLRINLIGSINDVNKLICKSTIRLWDFMSIKKLCYKLIFFKDLVNHSTLILVSNVELLVEYVKKNQFLFSWRKISYCFRWILITDGWKVIDLVDRWNFEKSWWRDQLDQCTCFKIMKPKISSSTKTFKVNCTIMIEWFWTDAHDISE